jgi:hypothetical protein
VDFYATEPQDANPFASTVDDPRELQKRVLAVMERAERRRVRAPRPTAYWEEPGHHGTGREVVLRRARAIPLFNTAETRVRKALRLPPLPKPRPASMSGGTIALVAVGAVGAGVLIGYLWNKRRRTLASSPPTTHVSGLELLGCEP